MSKLLMEGLGIPQPLLVVLCGAVGAGKTKYYADTSLSRYPKVDTSDYWGSSPHEDKFDTAKWCKEQAHKEIARLFNEVHSPLMVYEATNLTMGAQQAATDLAEALKVDCIFVWIATTSAIALGHLMSNSVANADRIAMLNEMSESLAAGKLNMVKPRKRIEIELDGRAVSHGGEVSPWWPVAPWLKKRKRGAGKRCLSVLSA